MFNNSVRGSSTKKKQTNWPRWGSAAGVSGVASSPSGWSARSVVEARPEATESDNDFFLYIDPTSYYQNFRSLAYLAQLKPGCYDDVSYNKRFTLLCSFCMFENRKLVIDQ